MELPNACPLQIRENYLQYETRKRTHRFFFPQGLRRHDDKLYGWRGECMHGTWRHDVTT